MMDNLHAYWRIDYVERAKSDSDDPFKYDEDTGNDGERLILFRSKFSFAIMNKYPYNPGHLLVLPHRAVSDIDELSEVERVDFFTAIGKAESMLKKALSPDGFNIGMNIGLAAGAGIPKHLHCHVVPRWNGDTNFMPVVANTKVLAQSQRAMFERLIAFTDAVI
ncbi:MAG: HIT domain-containing protein [Puniceicoccales bacterium]|jgi:ATP adenylyltransferase|nr:HIT domain-containing protein [Puniceicoccales bacterium]